MQSGCVRGIEIFWWYCLHKVVNYFFFESGPYIRIRGWPGVGCLWRVALPVQVNSEEGEGEDEENQEDEGEGEGAVLEQEEVIRCHQDEYLKVKRYSSEIYF